MLIHHLELLKVNELNHLKGTNSYHDLLKLGKVEVVEAVYL